MQVEFYNWLLPPDAWNKKPRLSRWKMSRQEAEKRYPGAEPDLSTREVRDCPEPGEGGPFQAGRPYGQ